MVERRTKAREAIRAVAAGGILISCLISCHAATPEHAASPARAERSDLAPLSPRWLVLERAWIERTEAGLDRAVVNGRRAELAGAEIASLGPVEPEVDGGAKVPAWALVTMGPKAVPNPAPRERYLFWKGKQLFAADTFAGPLTPIATLPAPPSGAFSWVDGAGLLLPGGALLIPAAGGAPKRMGVPTVTSAAALDARRGMVTTALGHAFLTLDGGASFRDVSKDLGGAPRLSVRGESIVATLPGGREKIIDAAGTVRDPGPGRSPGRDRDRAPPEEPDLFRDATGVRPREAAARAGLPLADGGVVVSARGFVGRFDAAAQRTTSIAPLDPGLQDAECAPVKDGAAILLACVGPERAAIVDVTGAPRTERTFDLAGASDLDRFVATESGAIGFVGPCAGKPRVPEVETIGGEPYNASRQRSPVFCARADRDTWIEHRVEPDEARDVVAWIPRPGGSAVALVLRQAAFLADEERVSARGPLRVVRLARSEPPLSLTPYAFDHGAPVSRDLYALADNSLAGFLPGAGYTGNLAAVRVDPAGHVTVYPPPPRVSQAAHAGRFAIARGDDGRFWESTDAGARWREIEPPPGARQGYSAAPSACSPAGCVVGNFVRLGWGPKADALDAPPFFAPGREAEPRRSYRRPEPYAAARLSCAAVAPAEGRRNAESGGFGYSAQPTPRGAWLLRIGQLGFASRPPGGAQWPTTGDVEVAWLPPLDPAAPLKRATLSIARLGVGGTQPRSYDLRVGYLLGQDGELGAFAIGPREGCLARILDVAGLTRPLGDCAEDRSVGVDLGGRVILVRGRYGDLDVSAADAPQVSKGRGARPAMPAALRSLATHNVGASLSGVTFGVGSRAGAPVIVAVDAHGDAALAPIDPERGTLGAEEHLRPLSEAALGSHASCAPRDGEARVVLPFEGLIGLDRTALRGVAATGNAGVAVLRWSRERACLDAVEIPVRDDRFDDQPGPYDPHGTLRKLIARFDKRPGATLALIGLGTEVRQKLACTALVPGPGDVP